MKFKFLSLFFSLFCLLPIALQGQQESIDSLRLLIPGAADTARVTLYFQLSMKYQNNLTDSALYFANAAINESRDLGYVKGEADGLISLGRIERDQGKLAEGLKHLSESLDLYRKINDLVQMGNAYNDISIVYAMSDDYEKSLEFFKKALGVFRKADDSQGISYALNNIGIVYEELGQDSLARAYYIESLNIKEQNSDTYGIGQAYVNLANIMQNYELYDESITYYFKADSAFSIINDQHASIRNYVHLADAFLQMLEYNEAWKYAYKAYNLANEYKFDLFKQDALQAMVEIKEATSDYKAAFEYQKEYQLLSESLANSQKLAAVEELKAKFDVEEKDREIQLLRSQKLLDQAQNDRQQLANYLLVVSVIFMVIVAVLLGWGYLHNQKKNKILIELNREKDQFISILSHDVKGPLNTLKGFSSLIAQGSSQISKEELAYFGDKINHSIDHLLKLVNGILEWFFSKRSTGALNPQELEVAVLIDDVVKLYELTADQKNVKVTNNADPKATCLADKDALLAVLRNLLSNAIKFSKKGDSIKFTTIQSTVKHLKILITDSGVGISKADLPHVFEYSKKKVRMGTDSETGSGLGLALSKELIETSGGELNVESEEGVGSQFSITLPA